MNLRSGIVAVTLFLTLSEAYPQCPTPVRLGEARYPKSIQNQAGNIALTNTQDSLLTAYEFDSVAAYDDGFMRVRTRASQKWYLIDESGHRYHTIGGFRQLSPETEALVIAGPQPEVVAWLRSPQPQVKVLWLYGDSTGKAGIDPMMLPGLETLYYSAFGSSAVDEKIFQFPNLRHLVLREMYDAPVPRSIINLQQLESLRVTQYMENHFKEILPLPEEIGQCRNLKALALEGFMVALPKSIGNLHRLRSLYVSSECMQEIPDAICELDSLESMRIYCPQVSKLPRRIGDLQRLRSLNLIGCALKTVPASFYDLRQLEALVFSANSLGRNAERIGELQSLTYLAIGSQYRRQIYPESIGQLQNLCYLSLGQSPKSPIPDCIGALVNLKTLDLSFMFVDSLPPVIQSMHSLEKLGLFGNPAFESPEQQAAARKQMADWIPNCKVYF